MSLKNVTLRGWRGINNVEEPERVQSMPSKDQPLVELIDAVNVDLDDSGRLSRRAGQTLKVAGNTHSLWSNGELAVYVKDGVMYRLDENMASTAIAGGLSDAPVSYVEVNDRIYHANGRTAAVIDEGRVRSWGIRLSDIDVAASATDGVMEPGVYLFAATLIRRDGQESGALMAQRIDLPAGGGIAFSWSVPADPDLVEIALYLSQPDGETLFQAVVVDVEAGGTTYTGGPRSLPLATQWLDAPPVGHALALYRGRIYIAVQDLIYATSPVGYEYCDLRDYRAIDGSEIRVLAPVSGGLFVGTARNVWFLSGTDFKESALDKKLDGGAIKGSLVLADGELVTGNNELSGMVVALFATESGVVLGLPDGTLQQLTMERYDMIEATTGAAILRAGSATQYLLAVKAGQ